MGQSGGPDLSQVQKKIAAPALTEKIQELAIPKIARPQVWCTGCNTEGHLVSECPGREQAGPFQPSCWTSPSTTLWRSCASCGDSSDGPTLYHAFPNNQAVQTNQWILRNLQNPWPSSLTLPYSTEVLLSNEYLILCILCLFYSWHQPMSSSGCTCGQIGPICIPSIWRIPKIWGGSQKRNRFIGGRTGGKFASETRPQVLL